MSARPPPKPNHGSLRWVRDVLGRSMGLEQRRKHMAADARSAVPAETLSLLTQQRAELGARLLVHDPATQPVKNLFVVHDQLGAQGWAGVESLPMPVVGRALFEAEILASDEPSPMLETIIERLQSLVAAAAERSAEEAREREWQSQAMPDVSETNYDEYELMERSWVGTVPAGLDLTGTSPGRL